MWTLVLTNVVLLDVAQVAINGWIAKQHHHDGLSISVFHYMCTMSLHSKMLSVQHRVGSPEGPGTDICIKHPQFICYVPRARIQLPTKHVDLILQRVENISKLHLKTTSYCASIQGKQKLDTNFTGAHILQCIKSISTLRLEESPQRMTSSLEALLHLTPCVFKKSLTNYYRPSYNYWFKVIHYCFVVFVKFQTMRLRSPSLVLLSASTLLTTTIMSP